MKINDLLSLRRLNLLTSLSVNNFHDCFTVSTTYLGNTISGEQLWLTLTDSKNEVKEIRTAPQLYKIIDQILKEPLLDPIACDLLNTADCIRYILH